MYTHPILPRISDTSFSSGIFSGHDRVVSELNAENPEEHPLYELLQGNPSGKLEIYDSIEEFFRRMANDRKVRESLGIPPMNYLAFSYSLIGIDTTIPIKLIERCRELEYEVRAWVNPDSACLIVCAATHDLSEESGWDIYEWANEQENAPSDSYGHSSWFEFCQFGVPIYPDWKLDNRMNSIVAVSPDGKKVALFGL